MSNANTNNLVKKEMYEFLSLKGLSLDVKHSNGAVNPRKNCHSTWVGVDTKMPNTYLSSTTVAEYADAYFKGRGLDESEHVWCPVALADSLTGAALEYNLDNDENILLDNAEGFIFIKTSDAILLLNSSAKDSSDTLLNDDIEDLFNDDIKYYRAWDSSNIFNITISTNKESGLKAEQKDVYNVNISDYTESLVSIAINSAIIDIVNQIEKAKDAVTLTLELDIETTERESMTALEHVVSRLKSIFGLNLEIGHHYYDRTNKTLDIVFLGGSVSSISSIRKACQKDFDLLQVIGEEMTELDDSGEFVAINAWGIAAILVDEVNFNNMPSIMKMALIRSIFNIMKGVKIQSVVWKNT